MIHLSIARILELQMATLTSDAIKLTKKKKLFTLEL